MVLTLGLAIGSGSISGVRSNTSRYRPWPWLTINSHRRNAASSRLRRSILPHSTGLSRNYTGLSSMARSFGMRFSARRREPLRRTRYRAPRRWQQRQHSTHPSRSFKVRDLRPHCGQRKKLHEPPFANSPTADQLQPQHQQC